MSDATATQTTLGFAPPADAMAFRLGPTHGFAWRHPTPSAVLVFLHGLQSHAGWFAAAGDAMLERGLSTYALDRCGSGSSPGARGDIEHYDLWLAEIERVVAHAHYANPGVPVHLVGHCFGANLALGAVLLRRVPVRSLVMLTPGLHVLPQYRRRDKLQILVCGLARPRVRFPVPQRDELFTRDPELLRLIRADRLGARMVTARCLLQAERLARRLRRRLSALDLPLLVLEAERDRISDNVRNRALLNDALATRWHVARFDAEHFLVAESCRELVFDALAAWTEQQRHPTLGGTRS